MPTPHIHDAIEDRARAGDGQFAIAFALLELAKHQEAAAKALDRMGMNSMSPTGPPGTLEMIAMQMKTIAEALAGIAAARSDTG